MSDTSGVIESPETLLLCGVYCITNTVNGKRYVGSTGKSFDRRWKDHLKYLRKGEHGNRHLQAAWTKHGEKSFSFDVILVCDPADCLPNEQKFIDAYDAANRIVGYNLSPTAGSSLGVKLSEETRRRIGASQIGRTHTAEARVKIGNARRGQKHTPETLARMSQLHSAASLSQETRLKMSASQRKRMESPVERARMVAFNVGRTATAESKAKVSESLRRYYESPENRAKLSARIRGRKHSKETRAKMSAAQTARFKRLEEMKNAQ